MPCSQCQKSKSRQPDNQQVSLPTITFTYNLPSILEKHQVGIILCAEKSNMVLHVSTKEIDKKNPDETVLDTVEISPNSTDLATIESPPLDIDTVVYKVQSPQSACLYDDTLAIANRYLITLFKKDDTNAYKKFYLIYTNDLAIKDVTFDKEGKLLFVDSLFSSLNTTDFIHNFIPLWQPNFITDIAPESRCKLNGFAYSPTQPAIASALSTANKWYKAPTANSITITEPEPETYIDLTNLYWHSQLESSGVLINIDNGNMIENLCLPHSPRWYKDTLYFLNSGQGELCKVVDNEVHTVAKIPSFAQGLDFVANLAFIGISPVFENQFNQNVPIVQTMRSLKQRAETIEQDLSRADLSDTQRAELHKEKATVNDDLNEFNGCGVWIVDILRGESLGYVQVDNITEINDIKLIPIHSKLMLETPYRINPKVYKTPTKVYKK